MRSIALLIAAFVLTAIVWVAQTPTRAQVLVDVFADPAADHAGAESELRRLGSGALPALEAGLRGTDAHVALRCARLLALRGDRKAENFLLRVLREHAASGTADQTAETDTTDSLGALAEAYLQWVWDQRDGPDDGSRAKLNRFISQHRADYHQIALLNELLEHYPGWCNGYVRRAKIFQRNGDAMEARRDALKALEFAPEHFDAIVVLGQVYAQLDAPQQAQVCMEKALRVNPRLKTTLKDDLDEIQRAGDAESERARRERRKDRPAI